MKQLNTIIQSHLNFYINCYLVTACTIAILLITSFSVVTAQTVTTPCSCSSWTNVGSNVHSTTSYNGLGYTFQPNTCYYIKGKLEIDVDATWLGVRLKMDEKSQIFVKARLDIDRSYISGCGVMWQGIETEPNVVHNVFIYNSTIEDANIAVKLNNDAGFVSLYNKYINDYVGIAIGSPFDADQFNIVIHRFQVWGNKFYTYSVVPNPYPGHYYYPSWPSTPTEIPYNQGFAAIYFSGANGCHIGYKGAVGADRNEIYQMRNGIITRNSVSDIYSTRFHDFEGLIPNSIGTPILDINQNAINMYRTKSTVYKNRMDSLMVGIQAVESNNTIFVDTFNISTPSPGYASTRGITALRPQNISITNNIVNEGMRGISIEDVVTDFLIQNNDLDRTFFFDGTGINVGIFVKNARLVVSTGTIENNDISMNDALVSNGIHLISSSNILVEGNDIEYTEGGDHQSRGIIAVSTTNSSFRSNLTNAVAGYNSFGNNGIELINGAGNLLFCNTSENFYIDQHYIGLNTETKMVSNHLNSSSYGLGLTGPTILGPQVYHANTWPDSYDEFGAYIFGPSPEITAKFSRFTVYSGENSDHLPDPIGPETVDEGVWFRDQYHAIASLNCGTNIGLPVYDPDTLAKFVTTELDFSQFNDESTWLLKADIYDFILNDQSLTSNNVLDSFYDVESGNPLGQLVTWQNELSSRFGVLQSDKDLTLDTINFLSSDILFIDSILTLHHTDSATWLALRVLKIDTLANEMSEWIDFLDTEHSVSISEYDDIETELKALTATNDLEEYLQLALIYKVQYLKGVQFSSGDSSDLVDLSEMCPWLGGRAIGVANELYSSINNKLILPSIDNCPSPSPFQTPLIPQPIMDGNLLNVYPLPVNDVLNISSPEVINNIWISDLNLKQIISKTPEKMKFELNVRDLLPGTYILTIESSEGSNSRLINIIH